MPPSSVQPTQIVDLCWAAYRQAFDRASAAGKSSYDAKENAREAYLHAMPRLDTRDDIRAFIACVTYGMLFDVFWRNNGSELIAAARIAAAALPREPGAMGRPKNLPADPLLESNRYCWVSI